MDDKNYKKYKGFLDVFLIIKNGGKKIFCKQGSHDKMKWMTFG